MVSNKNNAFRNLPIIYAISCVAFTVFVALNAIATAEPFEEMLLEASAARTTNQSLLWGTYRPNLYFGVRPRFPESLMTGLMWFGVDDLTEWQQIRHACEQEDNLDEYSYKKHDGRTLAVQTLTDSANNVTLKTEFLKVPGGEHGGNWGVRISGVPNREEGISRLSILYYFGLNGEGSLELKNKLDADGLSDPILLKGESPELGSFSIEMENGPDLKIPSNIPHESNPFPNLHKTQYWGHLVPGDDIWRAKEYVNGQITLNVENKIAEGSTRPLPYWFTLRNKVREDSNFYVFQKIVEAPFQFDIYFNSDSSPTQMDTASLTSGLESSIREFDQRFEKTFGLSEKGFNEKEIDFAKMALSNLIGGIGYFYGSSIVDRSYASEVDEDDIQFWTQRPVPNPQLTPPAVLFTATPSRSFFPRGFYWDEGFHQILLGKWDNDLSLEVIKHWTSLIDSDGWVAREQILGEEARSKVPLEFQTQYPHYANPPTLLMSIMAYIERLDKVDDEKKRIYDAIGKPFDDDIIATTDDPRILPNRHVLDRNLAKSSLRRIYSKIKANYRWFKRTQWGEIKGWGREATSNREAYRWRGRTPGHTLTSGLDDYPRPSPPHPAELHTDLLYLHWSETDQAFCDLSVNEKDESVFVCHKGYLSLFPMLLGLIPHDSPKLGAILDIIDDPEELWSKYGVRSLSKSNEFFNTGENYWRGPIWININYLVLSSIYKNYAPKPGPYQSKAQKIYKELRKNVIKTVYQEYERTGYPWEQYSALNGKGRRSHPFTGWTALVTLIMAENY
ncbi:9202_t:CDS:10 [Ambispora leptoticha]|uniref:Mannosyl-oligosaccharide glucosidase n=1 Tax=Ambispora leptoticha TaxID=144679 RepID=A0A9N8VQA5_9GLOM|nr:9202_t:CDS:10 [Ambispora leptoticha]